MNRTSYQRKKTAPAKEQATQRNSKPTAQAPQNSGSKNEETHLLTTRKKSHSNARKNPPIDSLQSLTEVSIQLDTLERKRNESTKISDDKSLQIYAEATPKQYPTNAKKSKLLPGTTATIPLNPPPPVKPQHLSPEQIHFPPQIIPGLPRNKLPQQNQQKPPVKNARKPIFTSVREPSIPEFFQKIEQQLSQFLDMIKSNIFQYTDENFFDPISSLQNRIQEINDIITSTKPLVLEIATRGTPRPNISSSKTRDENHKSCEKALDMHLDEEDPPGENGENFGEEERYYEDFPTTSKLNFSPQKIFSPRKHRPTKASRPAEDYQHSKWAQYSDYDDIAQAIYKEEGISGSLKTALISMAKMNGKMGNMVDDLKEGQRSSDKKLDVMMEILQELRPHKQDQDPNKKHPRSDPSSAHLALTNHQSYAAKASFHQPKHPSPSSHNRLNQTDYCRIPHLLISKFMLTTKPQFNKPLNPQTFYIIPKKGNPDLMEVFSFPHINLLVIQTCRKIKIAPPTRMAPLKSGHKIIVVLHSSSDVPLLMNALSLPNDLMVSEYVTPPQPVKLMLNGVSNPLLGPPNIVQTIFASNETAL